MNRSSMPVRASLSLAVALAVAGYADPAAAQNCTQNPSARITPTDLISVTDHTATGSGTLVPTTVSLDGTRSKGDTYAWTQIDKAGPKVKLNNAGAQTASFVAPDVDPGKSVTLEFQLTVTGCTKSASDTVLVNVSDKSAQNTAPVASASFKAVGTNEPVENGEVQLFGSAVDDGPQEKLTYSWQQIDNGPKVTWLTGVTEANPRFIVPVLGPNDGALKFRLTVSDGSLTGVAEVTIGLNRPPAADAVCPLRVNEGGDVVLDGRGSLDSDNNIVSYSWQQTTGLPTVPVADVDNWDQAVVRFKAPQLGQGQIGNLPFRLVVTDAAGKTDDAECSVMIDDVTPPTIAVPSQDVVAEATSAEGADVLYSATAFDLYDGALALGGDFFACTPESGSTFKLGTTVVACDARDWAKNAAETARFNVIVRDTTAPAISVPERIAREATGKLTPVDFTATALDVVDGPIAPGCDYTSGSSFPVGETTVTCSVTDAAGNGATGSFVVAIHDLTKPVVSNVSADLVLEAESPLGAVASYTLPTATDLVDGDVAVSCDPASGATFGLGTHAVVCTAADSSRNIATAGFNVTVQDTTAPVIAAHAGVTAEAVNANGAVVTYTLPAVSDAVSPNLVASCLPASGSQFALGTTAVTCGAVDGAGNSATPVGFDIIVEDTTKPVIINANADKVVEATSRDGAVATFLLPVATDTVDGDVAVTCSATSGDVFPLGTTTVTCAAKDAAGNAAEPVSFDITVQDKTAPVLKGLVDVSVLASSNSSAVVNYTQPTSSDLVDGTVAVNCSPVSGSTFAVGVTTVNCSATDSRGNTATGTFKVSVGYNFTGFLQPVDNLPTVNVAKAGSAIPVKFTLRGNQGLAIMEAGFPRSGTIGCTASAESNVELTVTAGSSSLQYDATTDQYTYVWKTERSWTGCRVLEVKLKDGSVQKAVFNFR